MSWNAEPNRTVWCWKQGQGGASTQLLHRCYFIFLYTRHRTWLQNYPDCGQGYTSAQHLGTEYGATSTSRGTQLHQISRQKNNYSFIFEFFQIQECLSYKSVATPGVHTMKSNKPFAFKTFSPFSLLAQNLNKYFQCQLLCPELVFSTSK